jgi:hypothetical protein
MKTIKMSGREIIKISTDEERALRILRANDYAVRRSDLYWGRRYGRYLIDAEEQNRVVRAERRKLLGIYTSPRRNLAEEARDAELLPKLAERIKRDSESPAGKREARFWAAHSRVSHGLFGDPRRINLILKKLEEAE